MRRAIVIVALIFAAGVPAAFAYQSPGAPSGYVNDFASVLSTATKQALEQELTAFEKSTSNEITVVTVPNMSGDYVENFAVKLFEEWRIGKEEKDNGVLLLLSIEERKMRIEVGYGLEGALPDSVAQSILDSEMTPRLRASDYDGAVTAGAQAIEQAIKGEYVGTQSSSSPLSNRDLENVIQGAFIAAFIALQMMTSLLARSKSWWAGGAVGFVGGSVVVWFFALGFLIGLPIVVALVLFGLLIDYAVSSGYANAKARGVTPPWWAGGSGIGSRGGGFGGFGGGRSGGGGASGGW